MQVFDLSGHWPCSALPVLHERMRSIEDDSVAQPACSERSGARDPDTLIRSVHRNDEANATLLTWCYMSHRLKVLIHLTQQSARFHVKRSLHGWETKTIIQTETAAQRSQGWPWAVLVWTLSRLDPGLISSPGKLLKGP